MAGGIGSRFWPMSSTRMPKQFLDILGTGRTLLQQAFDRFSKVIPADKFFVVTSTDYIELVKEQLPQLNYGQIIGEPIRRNTAPCIAYAAFKINELDPAANMIVTPSDHLIMREEEFMMQIQNGLDFVAQQPALLTFGIKPSRPETGYGYIQIDEKVKFREINNLYKVKTFTEKPDLKMATIFMKSGEFFWNSGIFLWSTQTILAAFKKLLPDMYDLFNKGTENGKNRKTVYNTPDEAAFIKKVYSECKIISIDYGIMEKSDNVNVLTADFGWSDLGTWGSLYDHLRKDEDGNSLIGENTFIYDTKNCIINMPNNKIAVLQGLDGYIVVEADNMLLVCRRTDEQMIRQFVDDVQLKKK